MWPALRVLPVSEPIKATVTVPGSKSSAARLLIAAALADGVSIIRGVPQNDDIAVLLSALSKLGIGIEGDGDTVTVTGRGGELLAPGGIIDIHRSGTALRFLLPLVTMSVGSTTILDGDERLRERPVAPLLDALRKLGATIECCGEVAPITVTPSGLLGGGEVSLDATVSSQFISALLLSAPILKHGLTVHLSGTPVSLPYIELTIEQMKRCGVMVDKEKIEGRTSFRVSPQPYRAGDYLVPPDASTASYFWALGAVTNGEVTVTGLEAGSREPDMQVAMALAQMGCGVSGGRGIAVGGRGKLRAITLDCAKFPDGALTIAAVAAVANGETTLKGLHTLRHKESDRLSAVVELLRSLGIVARSEGGTLIVGGGELHGGRIRTHNDHRLAMIAGVLGAVTEGVEIECPHVVAKSCPQFWKLLASVGVHTVWLSPPIVSLVGFMGAGKSSVGALVGAARGVPVVELDELIVKEAQADSIGAIFEREGETGFREREHRALHGALATLQETGGVISTGGGIVERADNTALLTAHTTVVHLHTPFATVEKRLGDDLTRPLWRDRLTAQTLFQSRAPRYRAIADLVVETAGLSLEEVARVVGELWCEGVGK